MIPALYTVAEVAKMLKVSGRAVYGWLLSGRLRGLKAGDSWRVREDDLLAFMEPQKTARMKLNASGKARRRSGGPKGRTR